MIDESTIGPTGLPFDVVERIDLVCDRFERAWRHGERPRAEDFLAGFVGTHRLALLRDLLVAEIDARRRRGELPAPDEYRVRLPEDAAVISLAFPTRGGLGDEPPGVESCGSFASIPVDKADASYPTKGVPGRPQSGAPTAVLSPGTRVRYFGDFELRQILGQGGMGVVYKAWQRSLNRMVAVKMIRAGTWASDDEVRRFRNEAEAVANLDHPQIVTIHEVGEHDGRHYFSMKLVDGPSLAERLTRFTADPRSAAKLVSEVALAVHHAHQRGILHRDLKPSNIVLDPEGLAHVTDFGLAKKIEGGGDLSVSGSLMGTPSYMSPEQASGSRNSVTTAADVHGLGAVLYAMLTGRPPYQGGSVAETLEWVLERPPERPGIVNRLVTRDLETICLKCLEKDPKRRYESAASLANDLSRFVRGETILARPVGRIEALWRGCQRNPVAAAMVTALVALLVTSSVIGTAAAFWYKATARRESGLRVLANQARGKAEESAGAEAKAVTEMTTTLYYHRIALSQRDWLLSNVALADRRLDECEQRLRRWEWSYLKRLCHSELVELGGHTGSVRRVIFSPDGLRPRLRREHLGRVRAVGRDEALGCPRQPGTTPACRGHTGGITGVAFSPDGRRLASASRDGTVRVWDATYGKELTLLRCPRGWATWVAFSPDGRRLASAHGDGTVRVWDTSSWAELRALRGHKDIVFCVEFSPDGKSLASGSRDGTVRLWDPESGQAARTLDASADVRCLAFSPDSRRLVAGTYDSTARVWDLTSFEPLTYRGHARAIFGVAFNSDGRRIASCDSEGFITIWDPVSGRKLDSIRGHTGGVFGLAFSPDGRRLASAGEDRSVRVWDATSRQESRAVGRAYSAGWAYGMAFSPDGRRIVVFGGLTGLKRMTGARVCNTVPAGLNKPLLIETRMVTCVAWSPDGQRLACGGEDKVVRLWDVGSGREGRSAPASSGGISDLAFSPDGRSLAWSGLDGVVRIWDLAPDRSPRSLGGHGVETLGLAFSADGREIASAGSDGTLRVWNADRGGEARTLPGFTIAPVLVEFSGGGRLCAGVGGDGAIRVLDSRSGRETLIPNPHSAPITTLTFSPDARRLASSSWDRTLKVWDAATGHEALTLRLHPERVSCAAFSPDGRRLASACDEIEVCDTGCAEGDTSASRFREAEARAPEWHLAQLYASRREGDWFAVAHHLDQLIVLEPGRWDHRGWRAWIDAGQRHWDRASAGFARTIELGPENPDIYYGAALLRLREGNLSAYHATCEAAARRFERARDTYTLNYLAWTCTLAPGAVKDPEDPVRWASDAVALSPRSPVLLKTLGATLYRAGRFEEAVRRLEEATEIAGDDGADLSRLFLAMSHARAGRLGPARTWLARAVAAAERPTKPEPAVPAGTVPLAWQNEIEFSLLLREAEALVLTTDIPDDPFAP